MSTANPATYTAVPARATFRAAFSMSRRIIRSGTRFGTGDLYATFLVSAHRCFGDAGFPIARAAAGCALARLHVSRAATGTRDELARQGMLTRCVRLEPGPFGGWSWAWTYDVLASANAARCLRRGAALGLRADRARRREVALGLAADRRAIEAGRFYAITPAGKAALVEEAAREAGAVG